MFGITWIGYTTLWAQSTVVNSGPSPTTSAAPTSVLMLAVRRWYSGLTLSPSDPFPSFNGLLGWLIGLGVLLAVAAVIQHPWPMLRQFFDIPGHFRLLSRSMGRLKRSTRMIGIVFGMAVLTWSGNQALTFKGPQGREDLTALLRGRTLSSLAFEQGILAGLTPLRDVIGLGSFIPLLIVGTVALFQFTSDKFNSVHRVLSPRGGRDSLWGTIAWGALALQATYRFLGLIYLYGELPLGGCLIFEALVVPVLTAITDGVVLAWVLVEIRNAGLTDEAVDSVDFGGLIALLPATILACVLAMPARYLATGVALALPYLPTPSLNALGQNVPVSRIWTVALTYIRWQLGPGLIVLQAAGLTTLSLVAASAWSRGSLKSVLTGAFQVLRREGGRLVALLAIVGLIAAGVAFVAYFVVLAIPTQPWVLQAADAYAHYATLPVGLLLTAALVELGRRTLPQARRTAETMLIVVEEETDNASLDEPIRVG